MPLLYTWAEFVMNQPRMQVCYEMPRRLNVTLPVETVRLIDRTAKRGNRGRRIDLD
jgi:hypothetical protein